MARPRELTLFAGLALGASLLNAVSTLVRFGSQPRLVLGGALGFVLIGALVAWVVVRRSPAGRIAVTVWLGFVLTLSLVSYAVLLLGHHAAAIGALSGALGLLTILLNLGALALLWSQPATSWLRGGPDRGPAT